MHSVLFNASSDSAVPPGRQLLSEMDGFSGRAAVIVMAATNRRDVLDPALTRPGRFDRIIYVGKPDFDGRIEILKACLTPAAGFCFAGAAAGAAACAGRMVACFLRLLPSCTACPCAEQPVRAVRGGWPPKCTITNATLIYPLIYMLLASTEVVHLRCVLSLWPARAAAARAGAPGEAAGRRAAAAAHAERGAAAHDEL